jgi:hypothetical protein
MQKKNKKQPDDFKQRIDAISNYLGKSTHLDESFDMTKKQKVGSKRVSEMKFSNDLERSASLVMGGGENVVKHAEFLFAKHQACVPKSKTNFLNKTEKNDRHK